MSTGISSDQLGKRILIGLVIGAIAGVLVRWLGAHVEGLLSGAVWFATRVCDPFGQVFFRILFFVVMPLVFASLSLGVVQLGRMDKLGSMAFRTFALFALNMSVAVAIGLAAMNVFRPGANIDAAQKAAVLERFSADVAKLQQTADSNAASRPTGLMAVVETFMPRNLLLTVVGQSTARIGDVIPLIVFALLVGTAGTQLAPAQRESLRNALEIINDLMTCIVGFALRLAPYAVPALIFSVVVQFGFEFLRAMAIFVVVVLGALTLHLLLTLGLMVKFGARRSPVEFFHATRAVLVTAFSTSSSAATLPTSIQVARERLGVSPAVAGFVLPLGATMNMAGTALFEGCVVLFIADVFGVHLALPQQVVLLLLCVISAVAVSAIPGGSLPLIMGLLANFGIPPEGLALVLGVDRILDMARTVPNVAADLATACVVERYLPAEAHLEDAPGASELPANHRRASGN